ncbi:polysaccharide pyruvyl transferase family protein [Arthrobacter mobilis]|uniref:Polysaccharide pyruvyl transferase family protein n=1 Tax=Arthrobacter mobilis TaxID=2724944 RepID=A0A7X6K4B1_9MICC|nr:polysaccharide pyruvyl transferase family protein [Arthrobacter mobilis]NKX54445.1 polysaccharide pyruvyl transferase family protein [Arthrobacter mobilis]
MRELVYLVSAAGVPNFGDEAIAAGWLRFLAGARPEAEVLLDCPNPGLARDLFRNLHPHLLVTDTLWQACRDSQRRDPAGVWDQVETLVLAGGRPGSSAAPERLAGATSIHLLGGGYVNAVWPRRVGLVAGMAAARQISGARLYGTGLGLLPACDNVPRLAQAFRTFDHVSCRDLPSAQTFGLPEGLDDLFLGIGTDLPPFRPASDRAWDVMVCFQKDLTGPATFSRAVHLLGTRLRECLDDGKSVGYVEALPGADRQMFEALDGLIPEAGLVPFQDLWAAGLPVRAGQEWYTSRFHLHLAAAAAGAAGTAIGVVPGYYDIKHRSLQDLGTGWQYTKPEGLDSLPEPAASGSFPDRCREYAAAKQAEAGCLYPAPPTGRYAGDAGGQTATDPAAAQGVVPKPA